MENLENKSSEGKSLKGISEAYLPMYKGLELVGEETFKGSTSIKYWM